MLVSLVKVGDFYVNYSLEIGYWKFDFALFEDYSDKFVKIAKFHS